jgi:hypothetical protein
MACLASSHPRAGVLAIALGGAIAVAGPSTAGAGTADPSQFYGVYVGTAEVEDLGGGEESSRDMDIVIEPFHEEGFQIHWINVVKVDGRRDVPGVRRNVQSAMFEPVDGQNFYVEAEADNPFREREETYPMQGHPVRWASIDGPAMHVYSFVVLEDGRYELQIYDRVLTEHGLDINFQRLVDGALVRQIKGMAVRAAEPEEPEEP